MTQAARARFTDLYEASVDRVMAYCLRHVSPSVAEDVVADTFMVAWRRLDAVPDPPVPWLLVTARNTIRNRYRAQARALQLTERLAVLTKLAADPADVGAGRRSELLAALGALTDDERDAILMTAWDGLSGAEAAAVAGTSHGAFRVRLHRARQKLATHLNESAPERSPR